MPHPFRAGCGSLQGFSLLSPAERRKISLRKIAKEAHPDLFAGKDPEIQKRQNDLFRKVLQAYELLNAFFKQRDDGLRMPSDRFSAADLHGQARREAKKGERFYDGPVPLRPLEIGLYLYYRGTIPCRAVIDALVWQRGQRPVMGTIARRWNWLDDDGVRDILVLRVGNLRFGERAVRLGLLSPFHVKALLWFQRSQQERLGQFFVRRSYLSDRDLDRLVEELHCRNARARARGGNSRN